MFRFKLGDQVKISISSEQGEIIARAEYTELPTQYQLLYITKAGCATEQWWPESALELATMED